MKIFIGSDHAGFDLKGELVDFLRGLGYEVEDCGAHEFDPVDDYPDFIRPVARHVAMDPERVRGIILGGSGQGEAILANRTPGVRAALYYGGDIELIELSRRHNDANVLSLGARFIDHAKAKEAVKLWLDTPFSLEERHVRRVRKIDEPFTGPFPSKSAEFPT